MKIKLEIMLNGIDRQRLKILPKCAARVVTSWMRSLNKKEEFTL